MPDRVAADNPAVETVRATLERVGRTDRPRIVLPDDVAVPDDPVRLVVDGRTCHARIERGLEGEPSIRTAVDSPRLAREDAGDEAATNHLAEWVEATGLSFGRSVLVDVVDPGAVYGLRVPGGSAVYEVGTPDADLSAIAAEIQARDDGSTESGDGATEP